MHRTPQAQPPFPGVADGAPFPDRSLRSAPAGTPLPERLRRALESLSGYDLDDVRVHAGSRLPALVGARALAYGSDVYLGPGAEDALAHEAWHVVQQMQGRVRATASVNGLPLNDDAALEAEADAMAAEAVRMAEAGGSSGVRAPREAAVAAPVLQRVVTVTQGAQDDNAQWWDLSWDANQLAQLRQKIEDELDLNDFDLPRINRTCTDLIAENLTFPTWGHLRKELYIRDCGYEVTAQLEGLTAIHRPAYDRLEADMRQWQANQLQTLRQNQLNQVPRSDWEYDSEQDIANAKKQRRAELAADLMEWSNATYTDRFLAHQANFQIFRWLTGVREADPLKMNCWETVLYALVRTRRVSKGYITWANETYPHDDLNLPGESERPLNLAGHALKIMDYFFASPAEIRQENERLSRNQPRSWISGPLRVGVPDYYTRVDQVCVPRTMVIPRGRLLIFQQGTMMAAHVAISTGRWRRIEDADQRARFQTDMGHEIIESDCTPGTLRYSTIEDCKSYLDRTLIVAPFPICPTSRHETWNKKLPPSDEEIDQIIRTQSTQIDDDAQLDYDNTQTEITRLNTEIQRTPSQYQASKLQKQLTASTRKLDGIWKQAEKDKTKLQSETSKRSIAKDQRQATQLVLAYDHEDPYLGAIEI
jgi:uncharacterized protein DUF4157